MASKQPYQSMVAASNIINNNEIMKAKAMA
jgi:hypothetical protein